MYNMEWLRAAVIRAVKTFAQSVLSVFSVGMALNEVDWKYAVSVGVVAFIYSILTSLAGLPEVEKAAGNE